MSDSMGADVQAPTSSKPEVEAGQGGQRAEAPAARVTASEVAPSMCAGCAAASSGPLVYAIGQLGYDFGTEARRDSIAEQMRSRLNQNPHPYKALELVAYLDPTNAEIGADPEREPHPWDTASILWTLNHEGAPIYAVRVAGPFARDAGRKLCGFLRKQKQAQHAEHVERVAVPGRVAGEVRLLTGQTVPVIHPEPRGMRDWCTDELVKEAAGDKAGNGASPEEKERYERTVRRVENFLDRVYHEHRNRGLTPQERALNYTATNAFNLGRIYQEVLKEKEEMEMELDTVEVERSPVCRKDSDCWDVKLLFFYSKQPVQTVRRAYRLTVDVSDVVPVAIGEIRSWSVR